MRCFQVWWCRNWSSARLCQYRLKLQNVMFQNTTSPHALKPLPDKPASGDCCILRASLSPCVGSYPLLELFLGAWLQNNCHSDENIPESNLATCLLLCLLHKEPICSQCAFVFATALLSLACVQHFILRILKCSISSNNRVRVCTLLRESKTETWRVTCGGTQLDHWNRNSGLFAIVFSSNGLWLRVSHLGGWGTSPRAPDSRPRVPHHRVVSQFRNLSDCYKSCRARSIKPLVLADFKVESFHCRSLCVCCALPSLFRPSALF